MLYLCSGVWLEEYIELRWKPRCISKGIAEDRFSAMVEGLTEALALDVE
jgi:hypothetical protein